MGRMFRLASLLAGAALLAATPAAADIKAGVDAWTRGDYPVAVREWQGPAAKGDADAQFNLAQAYKLGRGVKQDLAKAEELFQKAAAQGHLQASDNYGLLLFQRGQRPAAMPFIRAAAERGDPRAQYLLGVAHFNGDAVPKDWPRAYALVNLAQQAGLEQARPALTQMDQHIPLDQRQQGVALAAQLASEADATRARQLAAVDLGNSVPTAAPITRNPIRQPVAAAPSVVAAEDAVSAAARVTGTHSPATAGADYARPAGPAVAVASPVPIVPRATAPTPPPPPPPRVASATTPAIAPSGAWKLQLGAFGVLANADAQWNRIKSRPELAGHPRINARSGAVTRLLAGGFASREAAQSACSRLNSAGFVCIPVSN